MGLKWRCQSSMVASESHGRAQQWPTGHRPWLPHGGSTPCWPIRSGQCGRIKAAHSPLTPLTRPRLLPLALPLRSAAPSSLQHHRCSACGQTHSPGVGNLHHVDMCTQAKNCSKNTQYNNHMMRTSIPQQTSSSNLNKEHHKCHALLATPPQTITLPLTVHHSDDGQNIHVSKALIAMEANLELTICLRQATREYQHNYEAYPQPSSTK